MSLTPKNDPSTGRCCIRAEEPHPASVQGWVCSQACGLQDSASAPKCSASTIYIQKKKPHLIIQHSSFTFLLLFAELFRRPEETFLLDIFNILALHSVFRQKRPTSTCVLATLLVASVPSLALKSERMKEKKNQNLKWVSTVLCIFVDSSIWDLCIDRGQVGKNICPEHMPLKSNVTS